MSTRELNPAVRGRSRVQRLWALLACVTFASAALVSCADPENADFDDLAKVVSGSAPQGSAVWVYSKPSELMPHVRASQLEPRPATAVVVGLFDSLSAGSSYRIENGEPELVVSAFDDPDALWRDASLRVSVTDVVDGGESRLRKGDVIDIRVIVPLDWTVEQIESAYGSEPEALILLDIDARTGGYRVLGGVGEFYLPLAQDGTLDTGFVNSETLTEMRDFPRTLDEVRELARS